MTTSAGDRINSTIHVVANPAGGDADRLPEVRDALEQSGVAFEWSETSADDPGTGQTRSAVEQGAGLVIAVGGDGTVRACLEGIRGTDVPLGVVPLGTGNLLARNLDLPLQPADAVEVAIDGPSKRVDLGVVNQEVFAVMSGTGLDAEMMSEVDDGLKSSVGPLAYVIAGFRRLKAEPFSCTVQAGDTSTRHRAGMVLIGNTGRLPGGLDVFPNARVDDGLLHGLIVEAQSMWDWVRSSAALLGGGRRSNTVHRVSGTEITITLDEGRIYELDGEERQPGALLHYSIDPAAVLVRVPWVDDDEH